jgi:energy-coupling factor transporter ATP-binding protein EcfA2
VAAPALLEIEDLTFRYRRASEPAIRNLSLTVEPGEVLLVAGPSGCGKSTLIRAINGLIPHSYRGERSGSVRLRGSDTASLLMREIALTVGTVLQDPGKQIVGSTVETELAFGPENLGLPPSEIAKRIRRVAPMAGIEALVGRQTAFLSGGERQLLAVAGVLMMEPMLYVVDEPLANLDPVTALRLIDILRQLADEGHAVIMVEHRVEEALAIRPDRVLAMDVGRSTFLGMVGRFLEVADPAAVKLPYDAVLRHEQSREDVLTEGRPQTAPSASDLGRERLGFHDVHVRLGDRDVLTGVTASLHAKERVALLGPNGSGKTTMFRTAMRLLDPDAGTVAVDGASIAGWPVADLARSFGYVFQSPSQMLFARTVREELLFGPRNLGLDLPDPEALALAVLRRVGLADEEAILDRPPLTLSFGQQKRLALGIALALQPTTLILDEPSAGQDQRTAARFMVEVDAIPGLDAVYFITHDVDLALTHADRILVLRNGTIVANGDPATVVRDETAWRAANLHRSSLIEANLAFGVTAGRLLDAQSLARRSIAAQRATVDRP